MEIWEFVDSNGHFEASISKHSATKRSTKKEIKAVVCKDAGLNPFREIRADRLENVIA